MSFADLAIAVGVSPAQVSRWANGAQPPHVDSIDKIAEALKIPAHFLLRDWREDLSKDIDPLMASTFKTAALFLNDDSAEDDELTPNQVVAFFLLEAMAMRLAARMSGMSYKEELAIERDYRARIEKFTADEVRKLATANPFVREWFARRRAVQKAKKKMAATRATGSGDASD